MYTKYLYQEIEPYQSGYLKSEDGHNIYYEVSGNPKGQAIVYVHGGPGGGTSPVCRRYFDPSYYKIILFDQRGCGKSTPSMSLENNDTHHLVEDMENLRKLLKIEQWILFGGSWGTTLSLCYAIKYPQNVSTMILRGIFLARQEDVDWLYQEGASYFKPLDYQKYISILTKKQEKNILSSYHDLMNSKNEKIRKQALIEWTRWETALITLKKLKLNTKKDLDDIFQISLIENHYFYNHSFIEENYILNNAKKIEDIPTYIVHGEYDLDCRPSGAYDLSKKLKKCKLIFVPKAGHSQREDGISKALVKITKSLIK